MEPRLKTSVKRTHFPVDYIKLIKDVFSKAGGGFFTELEFASSESGNELARQNTVLELLWVKALRANPQISKELISDKDLLKISYLTRDTIFSLAKRKQEALDNSPTTTKY